MKGYREAKKDEIEINNKEYYTSNKGSILDKRKISYAIELHPFLLKHDLERNCVDVSDEEEDDSVLCTTCYSEYESVSNDDSVLTDSCYSNSCCSLNANCLGEQCSYNESGSINDFCTNYSDAGSLDNNSYEHVNSLDDVDVSDVDDDAINGSVNEYIAGGDEFSDAISSVSEDEGDWLDNDLSVADDVFFIQRRALPNFLLILKDIAKIVGDNKW
jgi:hypothetical protein